MDNQRTSSTFRMNLSLFCFVFLCFSRADGATISAISSGGILNETLTVSCSYVLGTGETFIDILLANKAKAATEYIDVARFANNGQSYFAGFDDLQKRSDLSRVNNVVNLNIITTKCVDEADYRCTMKYNTIAGVVDAKESSVTVTVLGRPEKPSLLTQSESELTEYDNVVYQCTSVVGRRTPIGSIKWEGVRGNNMEDLTSDSRVITESSTPGSCTVTVLSQMIRNVTRADNGLVIRCRTTHPDYQSPDHYLDQSPLKVYYPVENNALTAYQEPNKPFHIVGDRVTLKCQITTVPAATYSWKYKDSDQIIQSTPDFILSSAKVENSGTYTCEAVNAYLNNTFTATASINLEIKVAPTTTPVPTASPGDKTTDGGGGGNTDEQKATDDGATTTIIIVVVVVLLVLIIVIIIVVVIFKKRKGKDTERIEEPPEKGFNYNNNPNLSRGNQPDIVGDDKLKSPYTNPYNKTYPTAPYYSSHNNSFDVKSELSYGELNFDDRPRSRKPVAMSDADYADISMPHV